ncbi:GNAT family N-acetyltransferase [Kutzneria buriramensis]|uniref:Arsenite methyltransferase n=1 Tax=Kutzneria buriramensis TaxID=1045776 RepID=A0A3E0HB34_9PSEU|nr:GNAT family N-acetyltransferase [Kutzneria buriramensis]REH41081.1 L-amino acid N-acyltransferase YncA [Kutzneria buriramensis]
MTEPVRARYTAKAVGLADKPLAQSSLGCGDPVAVAELHAGETVLDLGSGAGLDVLVSARRVGPTGRAIGLDMTPEMLAVARRHAAEQGVANAEFLLGRIEDVPLSDESVDVVISNCVITLSADKSGVFAEIARVLRPGGRIGIADVLADFSLTDAERAAAEVECLDGSLTTDEYVAALAGVGLTDIQIRRTHDVADKLHAAVVRATKPIRPRGVAIAVMTAEHAAQVLAIYQAGLDGGNASFETAAPSWGHWDASHLPRHRFVALDSDGTVLGWIAASPVSGRCVYAGVLEHSVYVHPDHQARGIGAGLLDAYVSASEAAGVWTLQSGIFPENTASLALHRRAGFRVVGTRARIGQHHGTWRDVVLIERRSSRV